MAIVFPDSTELAANLQSIQTRIQQAALRANRKPEDVTLIAVSKTKPMNLIEMAHAAGQVDFGENKVQELQEKHPQLPGVHWHLIGGLQRNKVKYIAPYVHLIHSLDNEKLLQEINKRAGQHERVIDCLVQVNISEEPQKGGVEPTELAAFLTRVADYPNVTVKGLMGMAAFTEDETTIRRQFRLLRTLFEELSTQEFPGVYMQEVSMGMSGDYEIAIEEGSTMVRIGSAIFGARG